MAYIIGDRATDIRRFLESWVWKFQLPKGFQVFLTMTANDSAVIFFSTCYKDNVA